MTEVSRGRYPSHPRGGHLLEEAARLLNEMGFSASHGDYRAGDWVLVTIDPRWNSDKQVLSVAIQCSARGHQNVDWAGLPIYLCNSADGAVLTASFLNAQGRVMFDGVSPGRYTLAASAEWKRCVDPIRVERPGPWNRDESSADERVQMSLGRTATGVYSVFAEPVSEAAFPAGTEVFYCLVKPKTGQVSRCGRVAIGERKSSTGPLRALAAAGEDEEIMVFSIVPPVEQAGETHADNA